MKRNDILAFFVVGALILAGVYVGTGFKSVSTPVITNVQPGSSGSSSTTLFCAGSSSAPTLSLTAYYNDTGTVPPTPTQVATSYSVYAPGSPITKASGTSSSILSLQLPLNTLRHGYGYISLIRYVYGADELLAC